MVLRGVDSEVDQTRGHQEMSSTGCPPWWKEREDRHSGRSTLDDRVTGAREVPKGESREQHWAGSSKESPSESGKGEAKPI